MVTTLSRHATFYSIKAALSIRCSVPDCFDYGRYGTSSGAYFCGLCWRRLLVVRVAEYSLSWQILAFGHKEDSLTLQQWVRFAKTASNEDIRCLLWGMAYMANENMVALVDDMNWNQSQKEGGNSWL